MLYVAPVVQLVLVVLHVPITNASTNVAETALNVKSASARAESVPAATRRRSKKRKLVRSDSKNWTMLRKSWPSGLVRCSFSERLASRSHRHYEYEYDQDFSK